ncbi:MAG TPA: response regulator [Tepidisphaeraceae bacterium]|jgi:signal transduction histidine kinase/CheY-like chemotaxis protein
MIRFQQKPTPLLYAAIALSMLAILVADYVTPLGIVVWVLYVIPVAVSVFAWRPMVPLLVALLATVLMAVTYVTDGNGTVSASMALLNRGFGIATIWILAATGHRFILNRLAVRREQWLRSGHAGLNAKMIGEPSLQQLGSTVLRYLAEFLDAQAGAFYAEESGSFRRHATYAVANEADVPERFALGQGLLGQAAQDGRTFAVSEVPEGYITVGSALGRSLPQHLIVSPIAADGRVNAVLELAFLHPVYEADQELLTRVSESIGIAVRSAKIRSHLQALLEETQRQAEELQAQSEELRVSNEELEEQSRALGESANRLEMQQAELEQTNAQLEDRTQQLEQQRDSLARTKSILEHQARELEQASQYKSDFLANMSHELRTPLNSSLILSKLLADNREGNLTSEQVKYARTIGAAGNDLLALINDILDLSKIEAGRMEMSPEKIQLSRLLENINRTFEPLASQKALTFRTEVTPGAPAAMETDAQRLEQVLRNLISNAIKFTERGEVVLTVSRIADGRVAFSVRDTGIGIAEHQQSMIFEAFRQADGTTNRKYGGTGLGLSISRELTRLLGGEISLTSQPERGSTFTMTLPEIFDPATVASRQPAVATTQLTPTPPAPIAMPVAAQVPHQAPLPTPLKATRRVEDDRERLTVGKRIILIIEDDEPFAYILYDLARELNFQCLIATTAEDGQAMAVQYLPSAIVLDMGLPDQSGLSVLDKLKRDARTRHIPVHVVSGNDLSQTAMSLGAIGYMLKPVKREQLAEAFERLEHKLTQKLRRVLLVEDDLIQLDSLQKLLGSSDVDTIGVRTAADCLERLRSATFDCMVLDLSLPDASGFALLETLSKEDAYSFPPVIVYTGRDLTPEEEQRLRRYSKSIIIKGAKSPERLLDEVTLFLHQMVSKLPDEQQKMLEAARNRDSTLQGKRVLIVEDDVRNVFALTSVLEAQGVKLEIARNGREALSALERLMESDDTAIDLILMDIMMPEMDGLTATREIRKNPAWKKLPIIALTAKAMKNDQEQCIEAGANDYMAKPLDVEKLLSLTRVWMPR